MHALRLLLGLLFLCQAASAYAGTPQEDFNRDLATVREESYVAPRTALRQLEELKKGRTGRELGLVLVETSRAYYWMGDKHKSIDAAVQAEGLGRALHDDALLAKAMLSHA